MNTLRSITLLALLLTLSACGSTVTDTVPEAPVTSSSMQSSEASSAEATTELRGTIEPVGITIYQQGTHKLTTTDNGVVLLESSAVDLNGYVGVPAILEGIVRATVEADGKIMNVTSIKLDDTVSSSSSVDSSAVSSEAASTETSALTSAAVSSVAVSTASTQSTTSSVAVTDSSDPRVAQMVGANLQDSNWTQEYCSKQAPFCLKIHKNWWFTGFGKSGNELFRLDIGPSEINSIGDGVISVALLNGTAPSSSATAVYKQFGTQYIAVTGPSELSAAMNYIANSARKTE